MSGNIFHGQLDLNVLSHGLDRYAEDLPTDTVESLRQGLEAIQRRDPAAVADLVKQFQENEALDRFYDRSLRDLRNDYNTQERDKSLSIGLDRPSVDNFIFQDLINKIEDLLHHRQAAKLKTAAIKILKVLEKSFLTIEDLAYVIGQPQSVTQKIVEDLWKKGYIDYLQSSTFYILFPRLRSHKYRQSPVNPTAFLTLTRRGYFHLYPLFYSVNTEAIA